MQYEYLMRMAYNCGRNFTNGADADIYRKMEREHHAWRLQRSGNHDTSDRELEFRVASAKVKSNILKAINKALTQIFEENDTADLASLKQKLHLDEYNKETIDEVIQKASIIFRKNSLSAR